MALITPASPSIDANTGMFAPTIAGDLYAGEALLAVAPCYIKTTDGLVYMSNGTAADAAAFFDGFTPKAYAVGAAVTLYGVGARFRYAAGLTPGSIYFIGTTAGRLADAASTGDGVGVAKSIDTTDIRVTRNA